MQRKSSVRLGISVLLTAGVAAAAASLSPVVAAPADPAPTPQEGVVTGLQHDLGLGKKEARNRLAQEAAAVKVESEARRAAGKALGGSWFDAETGKLVVGLTDKGKADAVRATGAATEIVPNTVAELDAAKAELDAGAKEKAVPEGVHSWHVDPRSSSVVVTVAEDSANDAAVRAFLQDAGQQGTVTVKEAAHEAPDTFAAGVVGGDPYYINGNTRCSIGFSVHGGFVTAGHCGGVGSSVVGWDGSAMGTFEGSSFPGNDYAFVRTGHGWWTEPVVLGWGTVSDALVRGSNEAPIGSSICRSGSTTHWHCGTVLAKNETVVYGGDTSVHGLTKTSVCAEPGDSGGSFISGDQAQGVTSGGRGNCSSGGETWFQPVNEILNVYGLTLHTA